MFKTLGIKGASTLVWIALALITVATAVALSGIAQSQHICNTEGFEGVLKYFHPALQAQIQGKAAIIPFKCSSFQTPQWWFFAAQVWYIVFALIVVLSKKVQQYKAAVIGAGCISTCLAAVLCWTALEMPGGVYGALYSAGARTVWSCFTICIVNPTLMNALCDLDWALKLQRRKAKALALQQAASGEETASQEDSFKRSSSEMLEVV